MYTPTDDINLCPGGYVRYYNPCNDINHDLGGVIILVLGGWRWYESGGGGVGGGNIIHILGEWGWYTSCPGGAL